MNHEMLKVIPPEKKITHFNKPEFYDICIMVMPSNIQYDRTGYYVSYKGTITDLETGLYEETILGTTPAIGGEVGIITFSRSEYNATLDYVFTLEGRYNSFWISSMNEQFLPTGHAPHKFPEMIDIDKINAGDKHFYTVNWGQKEFWSTTPRLLWIFTEGYTKCHWVQIDTIEEETDIRVLKINTVHEFEEDIDLEAIDLITEVMYVRLSSDVIEYDYDTQVITKSTLPIIEDTNNYYDPWLTEPTVYAKEKEVPEPTEAPEETNINIECDPDSDSYLFWTGDVDDHVYTPEELNGVVFQGTYPRCLTKITFVPIDLEPNCLPDSVKVYMSHDMDIWYPCTRVNNLNENPVIEFLDNPYLFRHYKFVFDSALGTNCFVKHILLEAALMDENGENPYEPEEGSDEGDSNGYIPGSNPGGVVQ